MTQKCQTESPTEKLNLARLHAGRHKDCGAARADESTWPLTGLVRRSAAAIAGRDWPQARMKRRR